MRCDETIAPTNNTLCCIRGPETGLCGTYTGITVNSTAEYHTLESYCIMKKVVRICKADLSWNGETPAIIKGK